MKKILLMSILLMVSFLHGAVAQSRTISGRVTDRQTGEGLPGVTILLQGTSNGVSTNADGTYTLSVPSSGGTLTFSSIGYVNVDRVIGTDNQINLAMAPDTKQLQEVVVTGYGGSQDVKDITGSTAKISEEKLLNQPVQSFDQALTGRAAGVQITNPGGALADGVAIRIRGANSISNSSQPLIVIDGVPTNQINNANQFNTGNGTRYNTLADINPNDIESVDVLKDASAAAIYGSRAANGVVIITTKRGKAGQNHVSVNSYVGVNEVVRKPKLLNGDQFITIQNEKAFNRFGAGTPTSVIARDTDFNGDGKPDRTDWLKEIFRRGFSQNYQVAISGGSDKASYYGSGDWTDQKGVLVANRLRRGSVRLNLDLQPTKWLKAGISSSYAKTLNNGVLTDNYLAGATVSGYNAAPIFPVRDASGNYFLDSFGNLGGDVFTIGTTNYPFYRTYRLNAVNHPSAVLAYQRNDNTSQRLLANGYVTVEPLKGLKLTSRFGADYLQNFEDQYSDPRLSGLGRILGDGLVQVNDLRQNLWNWANFANYTHTFAENHNIDLTAGVEYQVETQTQISTYAANFADPKFKEILSGLSTEALQADGSRFSRGFESYLARANYSFGNRYYASVSFRADADSRFGTNNRRGYFPGGSIGWRLTEEEFMKGLTFVNDLKLRASYGVVGNSAGIAAYAARTQIGAGQYADINGLNITQVGNPDLAWEKSKKLDIGADISLLTDRIGMTLDYFDNNISDLILDAPALRTTGIPNPIDYVRTVVTKNIGSMYNRGFEATINTTNFQTSDGFRWTTALNFTGVKNRITSLATSLPVPEGQSANPNDVVFQNQRASVGRRLGVYFLPEWAGVNPDNGNAQFRDANGNIKQYDAVQRIWLTATGEPTTPISTSDFKYSEKSGYPTWFGGFDNTFSYKGLELGVFLQYSGGNLLYDATRAGLLTNYYNNNITEMLDRWQKPGDQTNVPKPVLQDNVSTQASTRWLEKGDFLRMRQISLGYNLPKGVLQRFKLSNVRVYGLVQNAFVITGYKGTDPEVNSNRDNSNIAFGVDNRAVPQPRSYTVGLNLSL
ncbi:SusC/RagA family TonB-linked outer membrane protein [Hymenobacter sp. BT491]|uniref:SusC/RagA family TonB-linked outer membrane protein n=1 Tax=Hymenobacter sp. BT491 TaxID=2766779 RepID=UPI001653E37B|nr:TonB-dependent receptor [Hymenobacter sp. BT491]MBC6988787.1 TonB-dependent receptor [Hymenobacter sp. BT491]